MSDDRNQKPGNRIDELARDNAALRRDIEARDVTIEGLRAEYAKVADAHARAEAEKQRLPLARARENAVKQLSAMQGEETVFATALCVIDAQGHAHTAESLTRVRMRPLSQSAIEAYIDREKPFDCAGSAKIESLGIALMSAVSSDDPTALIGLPLMKLTTLLKEAGIEVLPGL